MKKECGMCNVRERNNMERC